jgi:ankyrin repeat protein
MLPSAVLLLIHYNHTLHFFFHLKVYTTLQGDYTCAQLLIENAANLEACGDLGNRPLHCAAFNAHTKVGIALWPSRVSRHMQEPIFFIKVLRV